MSGKIMDIVILGGVAIAAYLIYINWDKLGIEQVFADVGKDISGNVNSAINQANLKILGGPSPTTPAAIRRYNQIPTSPQGTNIYRSTTASAPNTKIKNPAINGPESQAYLRSIGYKAGYTKRVAYLTEKYKGIYPRLSIIP